ncbi:MAG TPA: TAXI family TRAP transporter solute-binding subunit, partial [Synergistales bacterium]|nr:TAXI family TRAP transporter solute-binding subunit [Synergistales bacterium]
AIFSANDRMSEELVYRITKALWENIDELAAVHAQGKNVKLETALSAMSVPLHPGAEKYYKEVGLLK